MEKKSLLLCFGEEWDSNLQSHGMGLAGSSFQSRHLYGLLYFPLVAWSFLQQLKCILYISYCMGQSHGRLALNAVFSVCTTAVFPCRSCGLRPGLCLVPWQPGALDAEQMTVWYHNCRTNKARSCQTPQEPGTSVSDLSSKTSFLVKVTKFTVTLERFFSCVDVTYVSTQTYAYIINICKKKNLIIILVILAISSTLYF